jgi:16S rRNA processing protein RimM
MVEGPDCFAQQMHQQIPDFTRTRTEEQMQLQVARIGKPHGIRGEVTVQVLTDAPGDRFVPGTQFVVEPASAGPLTVESARWNKDILLLAFEEVETRNEAEALRGAKLYVETEELDEDDDEGWYEHELVGLDVRVGDQVVGKVSGLHTMPVQDLLVVTDRDGKEILIPFVEQIVPEVNVADKYVLVTPPAGLFEVNTEAGGTPDDGGTETDADAEGASDAERGAGDNA